MKKTHIVRVDFTYQILYFFILNVVCIFTLISLFETVCQSQQHLKLTISHCILWAFNCTLSKRYRFVSIQSASHINKAICNSACGERFFFSFSLFFFYSMLVFVCKGYINKRACDVTHVNTSASYEKKVSSFSYYA